jgi:hypothetical protein
MLSADLLHTRVILAFGMCVYFYSTCYAVRSYDNISLLFVLF